MQAAVTSKVQSYRLTSLFKERHMCIHTHSLVRLISWCVEGAELFLSVVVCEEALVEHLNFILTTLYISWSHDSCVEDI